MSISGSLSSSATAKPNPIQTTLFLLLIFAATITISSQTNNPDSDSECSNRRIYIRQLPTRFNLDLLTNCSTYYPLTDNFCPYLANHGLGQKTHNRSHSWYRTDPTMLELIFHRRILEYPCLVQNPSTADAIFLPYYGGIDSLRYLYGPEQNYSSLHGLDLYAFLQSDRPEIWARKSGHDHFLVMARTAWDFIQPLDEDPPGWGTSFLLLPEFYNVTALTFESRAWPWQEQAIPHPTSFHPPSVALLDSWIWRVRRTKRSKFALFAGGGGTTSAPNIRRSIREECLEVFVGEEEDGTSADPNGKSETCEMVDCSNGICEHDPIRFMRPMLQSTFCLQPPGETPARRATFDGIIAGCIPVFFEDQTARLQYQWHLLPDEFDQFSVTIPKEDVVFKGVKILDVLLAIPKEEVKRMQEKVIELIPRVIYRKHGSSLGLRAKKDAFDIAVDGVLERIKSRLESGVLDE